MSVIEFMMIPLVACLLLIIINVYFGIHVIKREIIFIDIALAQIAAFGTTIGAIIYSAMHEGVGHEDAEHSLLPYLLALAFTTIAAVVFSVLKNRKINIPLEAIIGIAYAVATTAAVIILDKAAGGDVHIHDMLVGSILWVTWEQVLRLLVVVIFVGIIHIVFRKKFTMLSDNYKNKECMMKSSLFWDFLFYFTFGIVIIEAVEIAGILTVFAFLILPASFSLLFSHSWRTRIVIGIILGVIVSFLGLCISWTMDVPCSPMMIIFMAAFIVIGLTVRKIIPNKKVANQ